MSTDETIIEQDIQAAGLVAPRLAPADIDAAIASVQFHVFPGTTMTVCALTLCNGFVVTGESAAAGADNFNREIGEKIAAANARQKIWPLLGFMLRQRLHQAELAAAAHPGLDVKVSYEP